MYYKYQINFYDETNDNETTDTGITYANSYSSAAKHIIQDYGKNNIIDMYLREITFEDEICINKEEIDRAFQCN